MTGQVLLSGGLAYGGGVRDGDLKPGKSVFNTLVESV